MDLQQSYSSAGIDKYLASADTAGIISGSPAAVDCQPGLAPVARGRGRKRIGIPLSAPRRQMQREGK
jgi:hypothetical protein